MFYGRERSFFLPFFFAVTAKVLTFAPAKTPRTLGFPSSIGHLLTPSVGISYAHTRNSSEARGT